MATGQGMLVEYMQVMSSSWDSGWLEIGGDDFGTNVVGDATTDGTGRGRSSIHPFGFISRPRDPVTDQNGRPVKGAGLLTFSEGGDTWSMPTTDPTAVAKIPQSKKGGSAMYSSPGGCINLDGDNGGLLVLVPYDQPTTKNYAFSIDPAGKSMQWRHPAGMFVSITEGGKNSLVLSNRTAANGATSDAYIEINDQGTTINGPLTIQGGLALGQLATALPVALAPSIQAWVKAAQAAITAIGNAANGIAPGCYLPAVDTALQALAAQVGTQGASSKLSASP